MERLSKRDFINYLKNGDIYYLYLYSVGIIIYKFILNKYGNKDNLTKNKLFQKDIKKLFSAADNLHTSFVSYSVISGYIYDAFKPSDNIKDINKLCSGLKSELIRRVQQGKPDDPISSGDKVLTKTIEYINLACIQMDTLHNKQEKRLENLSSRESNEEEIISGRLKSLNKGLLRTKNNLSSVKNNMQNSASKLYGHFISVLGIFITIIVAMSGGLSTISNSISAISSWNTNIYYVLLLSVLFSILLLFIVFFMFLCISKIVNKPISTSESKCIFKKYPIFSCFESILVIIFILLWFSYLYF